MTMTHDRPRTRMIEWAPVSSVQQIVFVAREGEDPIAVLEMRPTEGFRLTACSGEVIGTYDRLDAGEAALDEWLARD